MKRLDVLRIVYVAMLAVATVVFYIVGGWMLAVAFLFTLAAVEIANYFTERYIRKKIFGDDDHE